MDSTTAEPLAPAFDFGVPNQSVHIAADKASITDADGNLLLEGSAEVRLDLLPRAAIRVYVSSLAKIDFNIENARMLVLEPHNCEIQGFPTTAEFSSSGGISVVWHPSCEPILAIGDDNVQMTRAVFHLFNFSDLLGMRGSTEKKETMTYAIEHVDLAFKEWRIELKSMIETRERIKALKAEGGYALTHVGRVARADRSEFSGKEADESLRAIRYFLSFARGAWCEPSCAVGFDDSKARVWESWSSPRDSWRQPSSWFDPHHCEQLAELFPGFMARWADDDWAEAFREVIYWYLNSNDSSRGIDAGIILTQAAIERLCYEYAVRERRLIEVSGFKDLRASDKFRLLFSSLDIPIDIPSALTEMTAIGMQFNWLDSPHALTEMRNSLVHPAHKRRGQYSGAYVEAWKLGLWYLELAILRICGYSGIYGNRLVQRWVGQVEDVPWKDH